MAVTKRRCVACEHSGRTEHRYCSSAAQETTLALQFIAQWFGAVVEPLEPCECCQIMHCYKCGQSKDNCTKCETCQYHECKCCRVCKTPYCLKCSECERHDCICDPEDEICNCSACNPNGYEDSPELKQVGGRGGHGNSLDTPGWARRGVELQQVTPDALSTEWEQVWALDHSIDICQAIADFYLMDAGANRILNMDRVSTKSASGLPLLTAETGRVGNIAYKFDIARRNLVDKLDDVFQRYLHIAVAGELRHHRAVGGTHLAGPGNRSAAWVGWKEVFRQVGPMALKDAAELFRDFGGGAFGGERWALIAEVLWMRLTDRKGRCIRCLEERCECNSTEGPFVPVQYQEPQLPPAVFVDRVFNLQHNGGIVLSKVEWGINNPKSYGLREAQYRILPAHGEDPPNYRVLLSVASTKTRTLFDKMWTATNALRVAVGEKEVPHPIVINEQYRIICRYCNSNPAIGHMFGCAAPTRPDFQNGCTETLYVGTASGEVNINTPLWCKKIYENDWTDWDWRTWKKESFPIAPDGSFVLRPNKKVHLQVTVASYDNYQVAYNETLTIKQALAKRVKVSDHLDVKKKPDYADNNSVRVVMNTFSDDHGYDVQIVNFYEMIPNWNDFKKFNGTIGELVAKHMPNFKVEAAPRRAKGLPAQDKGEELSNLVAEEKDKQLSNLALAKKLVKKSGPPQYFKVPQYEVKDVDPDLEALLAEEVAIQAEAKPLWEEMFYKGDGKYAAWNCKEHDNSYCKPCSEKVQIGTFIANGRVNYCTLCHHDVKASYSPCQCPDQPAHKKLESGFKWEDLFIWNEKQYGWVCKEHESMYCFECSKEVPAGTWFKTGNSTSTAKFCAHCHNYIDSCVCDPTPYFNVIGTKDLVSG
jgi:hypothetical protein